MGPFDNESGHYLFDASYDSGHWYLLDGCLFIVPDAVAEIEGPDGDFVESLNEIYRSSTFSDVDPLSVATLLGGEFIHAPLRRFDRQGGFHVA